MNKKLLKVTLLTLVAILLSTSLVACGLFNSQKEIKTADVVAVSGLEKGKNEGEYIVYLGDTMRLGVDWHNKRISSAEVEWHEIVNGKDSIVEGTDGKTYSRGFSKSDLNKKFEYYVVVNQSVESAKITVTVKYTLKNPTLSANLPMTDGVVQQNLIDGAQNVAITARWNADLIPDDKAISVAWYVDSAKQAETSATFTFDVSGVTDECKFNVKVVLSDGEQTSSAEITLAFVKKFALVEELTIKADSTLLKVGQNTYYFKATADENKTKSFSTSLSPWNANGNAACEWTMANSSGTSVVEKNKRSADISLSYGKNVIKATMQNVESRQIIVYALDYEFDDLPKDIKDNIENSFFWLGNYYDSYISTQADLNAFMGYAISLHQKDKANTVYIEKNDWCNIDKFTEKCSTAVDEGGDESGNFRYQVSIRGSIGSVTFTDETVFGIPQGAYEPKAKSEQIVGYLRYSEQSATRTKLPIDEKTESAKVSNSNELYRAVSCGQKPIFADDKSGIALKKLYDEARDVLTTYVSDDMSDYEKVAVIYDWIVNVVDYDYAAAQLQGDDTGKYNAFYLEGVFNDHRAVCDGKSKAFALLCGMENIKAVRVVGYADKNLKDLDLSSKKVLASIGHAWNKVLIDADDDGVKEWYVVDTTWGDVAVNNEGASGGVYEYLNYAYFLKTDEDIQDTHLAKTYNPIANTDVNVYKKTVIKVGSASFDLYVESVVELEEIVAYSKANGGIPLSVYVESGVKGFGYSIVSIDDNQAIIFART